MVGFKRSEVVPPDGDGQIRGGVVVAPGGERCAFVRMLADHGHELWVADVDGGNALRLVPADGDRVIYAPLWSPDGAQLAFGIGARRSPGIERVAWCSSKEAVAELASARAMAFAWLPSSDGLLLADPVEGALIERPLRGVARVVSALDDDGDPHFPPRIAVNADGTRVALSMRRVSEDVTEVWLVDRSEPGQPSVEMLTEVPGSSVRVVASWSPDGRSIAMHIVHLEMERSVLIGVVDLAGEGEIWLEHDLIDKADGMLWTPSGNGLVLYRAKRREGPYSAAGPAELVLFEVATQHTKPLSEAGSVQGALQFIAPQTLAVASAKAAQLFEFDAPL
jgi:dipeptidyl aminopeptidase/acylaminoacyl peptidase